MLEYFGPLPFLFVRKPFQVCFILFISTAYLEVDLMYNKFENICLTEWRLALELPQGCTELNR